MVKLLVENDIPHWYFKVPAVLESRMELFKGGKWNMVDVHVEGLKLRMYLDDHDAQQLFTRLRDKKHLHFK